MASNRKLAALGVQVSRGQLDALAVELKGIRGGIPRAISGAINKTLPQGRTVIVNDLWALLAIKSRRNILNRTEIERATPARLWGVIKILGRRIGLINFEVKDTRNRRTKTGRGVLARAYRGGPQERFPHAFIATGEQGNRHVFERKATTDRQRVFELTGIAPNLRVGRLPIFSRKGLSLYDVFKGNADMERRAIEKTADIFDAQLLSQVDRILGRRKADRGRTR